MATRPRRRYAAVTAFMCRKNNTPIPSENGGPTLYKYVFRKIYSRMNVELPETTDEVDPRIDPVAWKLGTTLHVPSCADEYDHVTSYYEDCDDNSPRLVSQSITPFVPDAYMENTSTTEPLDIEKEAIDDQNEELKETPKKLYCTRNDLRFGRERTSKDTYISVQKLNKTKRKLTLNLEDLDDPRENRS